MLRTWVNTALGKTFDDPGESIEYNELLDRREEYEASNLPEDILQSIDNSQRKVRAKELSVSVIITFDTEVRIL